MSADDSHEARCRRLVEQKNAKHAWGLTETQIDTYITVLLQVCDESSSERILERVIDHYHIEHPRVAALSNPRHADFLASWEWVEQQIVAITQARQLGWSRDRAVELFDLRQIASTTIFTSLNSYRYQSSLRNWIAGVTVNCLRQFHRDSSASKRFAPLVPLEAAEHSSLSWEAYEQDVLASILLADMLRLLKHSKDPRFAQVFELSEVDGETAQDIAERLQLNESRIRALLKLARDLLREDPHIRGWLNDGRSNL